MRCARRSPLLLAACKEEAPPVVYQAVPVERRDIVVSARASGTIQPDTVVEVKSKASGEILELKVETGQLVKRGALMVRVDPRNPRNLAAQAQADLEVAEARLTNATSQKRRADELFKSQSITQQEHETALLDYANARAEVVRARVAVDDARNQLDDTNVLAPITGTIIEKLVERGQVISSPTRDVGGGTVLMKMADLGLVQVRTLVDETDIGKIQVGQRATVTVDAYPNRPFEGAGAQDRAPGADRAERDDVPGAGADRQPRGPPPAGDEQRGRGPRGPAGAACWRCRTRRSAPSATSGRRRRCWGSRPRRCRRSWPRQPAGQRRRAAAAGQAHDGRHRAAARTRPDHDDARRATVTLPAGVTEEQVRAAMAKRRRADADRERERHARRVRQSAVGPAGRPRRAAGGRFVRRHAISYS